MFLTVVSVDAFIAEPRSGDSEGRSCRPSTVAIMIMYNRISRTRMQPCAIELLMRTPLFMTTTECRLSRNDYTRNKWRKNARIAQSDTY